MSDAAFVRSLDIDALGEKVIEMADRVRVVDMVQPGARAKWGFTLDDVTYDVVITVREKVKA